MAERIYSFEDEDPENDPNQLQRAAERAARLGFPDLGGEIMDSLDRDFLERQEMLEADRKAWARVGIDIDKEPKW